MLGRIICPIAALVTFAVGVAIASLVTRPVSHSSELTLTLRLPATQIAPKAETRRTYHNGIHASGLAGRFDACFSSFASSDGMSFSSTSIYFNYPRQAQHELKKRLKKSLTIISREPELDDAGRVVGEQVVALFPPYEKGTTASAELMVVKGAKFVSIASSSLRNINAYKEDRKP